MYFEGHFLKRPRLKKFENYIFVTRKVWRIIWYAQTLGAIFFGTFWISTNRVLSRLYFKLFQNRTITAMGIYSILQFGIGLKMSTELA